ncbi:hypothetical protein AAG906_026344 [Vitis piasezkii]
MLRLASSLARDVAALRSWCFGSHTTCSVPCLQPSQQVEEQTSRGTTDIQPFAGEFVKITQPPAKPAIPILSSIGIGVGEEVENVGAGRILKCTAICKSPFVAQCLKQFVKIPHQDRVIANYALIEDVDPSEVLCDMHGMYITREYNLQPKATNQVIIDRCRMYLDADRLGHDLGTCDMHWHIHVMTSQSYMCYRYDCGILALKYMEFWNGLQLVVTLLLNEGNNVRDKIMQACQL